MDQIKRKSNPSVIYNNMENSITILGGTIDQRYEKWTNITDDFNLIIKGINTHNVFFILTINKNCSISIMIINVRGLNLQDVDAAELEAIKS